MMIRNDVTGEKLCLLACCVYARSASLRLSLRRKEEFFCAFYGTTESRALTLVSCTGNVESYPFGGAKDQRPASAKGWDTRRIKAASCDPNEWHFLEAFPANAQGPEGF